MEVVFMCENTDANFNPDHLTIWAGFGLITLPVNVQTLDMHFRSHATVYCTGYG